MVSNTKLDKSQIEHLDLLYASIKDPNKKEKILTLITSLFFENIEFDKCSLSSSSKRNRVLMSLNQPITLKSGWNIPKDTSYIIDEVGTIHFEEDNAPYQLKKGTKIFWTALMAKNENYTLSTQKEKKDPTLGRLDPLSTLITLEDLVDVEKVTKYQDLVRNFIHKKEAEPSTSN